VTFIQISADTEVTVPLSVTLVNNGTSANTTLTIPKSGHWVIGCYVDGSVNLNSFGATATVQCGGLIGAGKVTNGWTNTGSGQFHAGFCVFGDATAGQYLQVNVACQFIVSGTATGLLYAHFVPTPAVPR